MKASRIRQILLIIGFLVLPALFLRARVKNQNELNVVDRFLLRVISPVQKGFSYVAWKIQGFGSNYFSSVEDKKENDKLRQRNLELEAQVHVLEDYEKQVDRLQKLLGFRERLHIKSVAARVIQVDAFPIPSRSFTIFLAEQNEQVKPGLPVISMGGVVGKILYRYGDYAKVQLITDPNFSLLADVPRTGTEGILKGSNDPLFLQFGRLNKKNELHVGDHILTPGIGNGETSLLFPPNSLIGTIERVENPLAGFEQKAWVTPAVNLAITREVMVLLTESIPVDPHRDRRSSETGERRRNR